MRRPRLRAAALGATVLVVVCLSTYSRLSHATEEPDHQVVRNLDGAEVRQYAPYTVAEVVVPGPAEDAGQQAFPILADYIFGKNKGERKLAMTAPVTQVAAPVKLEMTAPVAQRAVPEGIAVQFVLPKGVTAANAPEPIDARIVLRDVTPGPVAVVRYSGFWSATNYAKHLTVLQQVLRTADLQWTGEPVYARYNAPFTPWFLRRNEIWLSLAPAR